MRLLSAMIAVAVLVVAGSAAASQVSLAGAPFQNRELAAEARAVDVVSRMTLAEKAGQIQHGAPSIPRLGIPAYNWWSEGLHGCVVRPFCRTQIWRRMDR